MADRSKSRRRYLWDQGWRRCIWCGKHLTWASLTCEHMVPRSRGGTDKRMNLAAACRRCNMQRSSNPWVPHPEVMEWARRRGLALAGLQAR